MTTEYYEVVRCRICGQKSKYWKVGSTILFGAADLDTRPPEMQRSTLSIWVQRCPQCGTCAEDVSQAYPGAQAVVKREEYRHQLVDPSYPELANSFLCKAMIHLAEENYAAATWALIMAAWACDDSYQPEQAAICREKAADMLLQAEEKDQSIVDQDGLGSAILVDLCRRSGQLDRAQEVLAERRPGVSEGIVARVLDFQAVLIENGDTACHTLAEVREDLEG